ncbi:STAS domain-containing protein [Aeromicrobium sp. 179-A 4D2 NHS]|uniref:STAS domain-containing protein n=1 Tax=Aeromicrobium sp. 179-A 4D2 NHS TaxID=3142375 RepID=UPI0039A1ECB9
MQTDFEFTCQPPLGRLRIVGDLDANTVDHLTDVLECLALRGCTRVEVDVEEVTYIDTRTLHVLHEVHRRLVIRGGGLSLVSTGSYHELVARHAGYGALLPQPRLTAQDASVTMSVPAPEERIWAHESTVIERPAGARGAGAEQRERPRRHHGDGGAADPLEHPRV